MSNFLFGDFAGVELEGTLNVEWLKEVGRSVNRGRSSRTKRLALHTSYPPTNKEFVGVRE